MNFFQKKPQVPNVSFGQAVNVSEYMKDAMKPAIDSLNKIARAVDPFSKFKIAEEKAKNQQEADNIFLDFYEKSQNEWDALSETREDKTKEYEKTYYDNMETHDKELKTKINKIEDYVIREDLRKRANNLKLANKEKARSYIFEQTRLSRKNTEDRKRQVIEDDFEQHIDIESVNNDSVFFEKLAEIETSFTTSAANDGIYDPNYTKVKSKEYADRMALIGYNKLARQCDASDFFEGYKPAKDFIESIKDKISPKVYQTIMHEADLEELQTEILRNTDKFVKDGEIDRDLIRKHGKNLTQKEEEALYVSIQKALEENAGNFSGADKIVFDKQKKKIDGMVEQRMLQSKFFSNSYYKGLQMVKGLSNDQINEEKVKDYKNINIFDAIDAYNTILELSGQEVLLPSGKRTKIVSPVAQQALKDIENYVDIYSVGYDDFLPTAVETKGFFETIGGKKLTPNEIALHTFMNKFKVEKEDGEYIVSPRFVLNAMVDFQRKPAALSGVDLNKPIIGSSYENNDQVIANLQFHLAKTMKDAGITADTTSFVDSTFEGSYQPVLGSGGDPMTTIKEWTEGNEDVPQPEIIVGGSYGFSFPGAASVELLKAPKTIEAAKKAYKRKLVRMKQLQELEKKEEEKYNQEMEALNKSKTNK